MKSASLSDVKNELSHLDKNELTELCLRLARYKKENKELLSYLLFDANDEENYKNNINLLIDENFEAITQTNLYLVKKSLRKILRIANKHIKYSQNKETEIDVLIHFCWDPAKAYFSNANNNAHEIGPKKTIPAITSEICCC